MPGSRVSFAADRIPPTSATRGLGTGARVSWTGALFEQNVCTQQASHAVNSPWPMHTRCLPAVSSPACKASPWPATSSWTQSGPIDTGRSARCPPPLTDQAARQASAEKPPSRWLLHSSSAIALPAFSTHTPPAPAARHPPDQATCAGGWRPPSRRRASARALDQAAGCVQAFQ